jgi:CubicO group peptidase (beta-lactamase class C family)
MRCTLALVTSLIAPTLRAQQLDAAHATRIDAVFARYANNSSPGCAVAVKQNGAVVHARGYGMASLEQEVPITSRTVFDIGSTSKQFTAASIMLLALDGKLALDDDVRRYLPELPAMSATVTLRHLLTHTSGWRDYTDLMALDGFDERDHTSNADAWAVLKRQRALNFTPGTRYQYSNTGFFLLGEVVARVSGRSLADFAHDHIFAPLGMSQTRFLDDTRQVVPGRATGYTPRDSGRFFVEMSDWDQVGDGAVQTSVEDLARWESNFDTPTVGGPKMLDLLLAHGHLDDGTEIAYTAGLTRDTYHGFARVQHGGAWAGYRAMLMRFPEQRLAVLLTCNRADANTTALAQGVADVLLPTTHAASAATLASAPQRATSAARYEGLYVRSADGVAMKVVSQGDTLKFGVGAQRTPLRPLSVDLFTTPSGTTRLRFLGERLITMPDGNAADTLMRTARVGTLSRAELSAYAGRYAGAELAVPFDVVVEDSVLVLHPPRGDSLRLSPVFADAFAGDGLPAVRFVRNAAGQVVAMRFTTGRGITDLRLDRR